MSTAPANVSIKPKPNTTGTFTLLTGTAAAPLQHPTKLAYAGRLDTPRLFLTPKEGNYDKLQCTFIVDSEKNTVRFIGTEKSHESVDTITGSLELGEVIEIFKLNTGDRWGVSKLLETVKRLRAFFATKEDQVKLLTRLRNWDMTVSRLFEEVKQQDGNAKQAVTTKVEGNIPEPFRLKVPIFKGYPKEVFEVEFGVTVENGTPYLYMDSPDLLDMIEARKEQYLKEETDYFTDFGCSVIHVS